MGLVIVLAVATASLAALLLQTRSRARLQSDQIRNALGPTQEDSLDLAGTVSRLVAAHRTAERQADLLSAAAAAIHIGVVVLDESGQEVFSNATAETFSQGRAGDAVVGLRLRALLETVEHTSEPIQDDIEVFTPSPRTIRLSCAPLVHGEVRIGTVAFVEDLTTRFRVDTIRRDFVSNASHELKTPLGALRLLAEALVATDSDEARQKLSERIGTEATRMTRLVEDILDLSLVEEYRRVQGVVNLCDVARDAVSQIDLAAATVAVAVNLECEQLKVIGDHRRLVSAAANLIENAVVYTSVKGEDDPRPVQVQVYARNDDAVLEVEDHGIGIPERHVGRIFERFYRVDRGRSRTSGGTGLGLAIVRHVVENHQGEVEVESVPGKGSIFRIVLPTRER